MGCCGKQAGKIEKVKSIVKGYAALAVSSLKGDSQEALRRVDICKGCDDNTFMTKAQYSAWLLAHGIEVLKNLDDLAALPMLEKQEFEPGRSLFCRVCKCWIPAKAYSKDEKCPNEKW